MDLNELWVAVIGGVTGAGVVGSGALWLVRPHMKEWVVSLVKEEQRQGVESYHRWRNEVDAWRTGVDKEKALFAQTLTGIAKSVEDNATRQTRAIERIAEKQEDAAVAVGRIEGALDEMKNGSR